MSRIIIINGSPRKNGVDAAIAVMISEEFPKKGHSVEVVSICGMRIGGCLGCMACRKTGECVQDDDMKGIISKIRDSDMVVLMSPIYFGAETGQTKVVLDRFTSAFKAERPFGSVKASSVLLTCADKNGAAAYDATLRRILFEMKCLKIPEPDGGRIMGGLSPETVRDSPEVRDYINGLSKQLDR
ncbi:MAG: flavodoxin family protein [Candidatus Methanomethylophilaceae archaeon]|nr:flavodoxin family protein [Candidatus Methanomethylophilaceae archaeon]